MIKNWIQQNAVKTDTNLQLFLTYKQQNSITVFLFHILFSILHEHTLYEKTLPICIAQFGFPARSKTPYSMFTLNSNSNYFGDIPLLAEMHYLSLIASKGNTSQAYIQLNGRCPTWIRTSRPITHDQATALRYLFVQLKIGREVTLWYIVMWYTVLYQFL